VFSDHVAVYFPAGMVWPVAVDLGAVAQETPSKRVLLQASRRVRCQVAWAACHSGDTVPSSFQPP
jgi:hypothetical protein